MTRDERARLKELWRENSELGSSAHRCRPASPTGRFRVAGLAVPTSPTAKRQWTEVNHSPNVALNSAVRTTFDGGRVTAYSNIRTCSHISC